MTSKIIAFILGIAIGAGICAAVLSQRTQKETVEQTLATAAALSNRVHELESSLKSTEARLKRAQEVNDALTIRAQELMQKEASRTAQATPEEAPNRTGLAALFGGDGTNGMSGAMTKMMNTVVEQQTEARLSGMKARLNLSPEQEQAIREISARQTKLGTELAQKMLSGELSREELEKLGKEQPNQESQIKAVLTPEQLEEYDDFQKEEQTRMARLAANAELMQLQSQLQLTEEQQDKVFAVLADQALSRYDGTGSNPTTGFGIRSQYEQRAEALKDVLTPEQFERYQKYQEQQLKLIESFMPGLGSNATIHVTPVISQ